MTRQHSRPELEPGQEWVWDYPRPPRLEPVAQRLQVVFAGELIADTVHGYRVLETAHPPTYYLPPDEVRMDLLEPHNLRTFCEWKGHALYWTLRLGERRAEAAAWSYPDPTPAFAAIRDHLAFYPSRVEACYVDGQRVSAQVGDYYGGWITANVVGPFKGPAGTGGW